jgi:phenylpropionate dioxygenase-like ring-hydroxylating dioxygenase large terminal subunit
MFVHKNQLAYQIPPDWYYSPDHYQREIDRLFLPTWHFVGCKADMAQDGDFLTLELLGKPVLIRNFGGEYHAFLNVCSHRHCLLTDKECGQSDALRCQYHGWEYEASGRTRRIPDAGCFRPFDRESARLRKFRLEACGEFLFVSLAPRGPSLEQYLGKYFDEVERRFRDNWRLCWTWQYDYPCNWKLPVENTVESYHLPYVHSGPFAAVYPSEAAQEHELHDDYSTLRYDFSENATLAYWQGWAAQRLGAPSTNLYIHHLVHPHFVLAINDLVLYAHVYLPTSPTTSRAIVRAFSYVGKRRNPLAWLAARSTAWNTRRALPTIQLEDASVMQSAQRGIEATEHRGCIGTREERVYAFQKFVRDRCAVGGTNGGANDERHTDRTRHSEQLAS